MPVTGERIAALNYINSVTDEFPNPNRSYKIDSSIENRSCRDYLPVNSLTSSRLEESYLEFIISPSEKEFINLDSILLELKIKITLKEGGELKEGEEESELTVIDGLGHTIISRCNVYLNGTPVETSTSKGIYEYCKTIISLGDEEYKHLGMLNLYKPQDANIVDGVEEGYFAAPHAEESNIIDRCKNVIQTLAPLRLDIANGDFYLLDNVEMRIRIDLQPASYIILSHQPEKFSYSLQLAKLHVERVTPSTNALLSLNSSMLKDHSQIEYIFDRPVVKNFVINSGMNQFVQENIFNGFIPSKLIIFFVSQDGNTGNYKRNPLHFHHRYVNSIRLDVNGQLHAVSEGSFPNNYALFLHNTIKTCGSVNKITYTNFPSGRSIFAFDLSESSCDDTLRVDKAGNLRLRIEFGQTLSENVHAYIIGTFSASVKIDSNRIVQTNFIM